MHDNITIIRGTIVDSYFDDDLDENIYIIEDLHNEEYYIAAEGFIGYDEYEWESYQEDGTEISFKVRNSFI